METIRILASDIRGSFWYEAHDWKEALEIAHLIEKEGLRIIKLEVSHT